MKVNKRKLLDKSGNETGAVLTVNLNQPSTLSQKLAIENQLIDFAFNQLYPNQGLNIYRDMYPDTPSITVIKSINQLDNDEFNL